MITAATDLLVPRILVVDDERQIHASLRLRLGNEYRLTCHHDPRHALALIASVRFDLCIVDIHMPYLDGMAFVEAARETDPGLGYIFLSGFDSDENLRRAIPLQVYDFISKPLPDRDGFEDRIPAWVERTRERRRHSELATHARTIAHDLDSARMEREIEFVASETARDALLQSASLLTTIQAHLVTASALAAERAKVVSGLTPLVRNLEEARRTTDAAVSIASDFFDSAYGSRDSSPAVIASGVRHAITIASRITRAEESNKVVDVPQLGDSPPIRGITGIDFLLMMVPAISAALTVASANSTVRIEMEVLPRLEAAARDPRWRQHLWVNRRRAVVSQPGVALVISASGIPLTRAQFEAWLKGEYAPLGAVTLSGLVAGLQKCHGLLSVAAAPETHAFKLVLALPT